MRERDRKNLRDYRGRIRLINDFLYDTENNQPFTYKESQPESIIEAGLTALRYRLRFLEKEIEQAGQVYIKLPKKYQDGKLERVRARAKKQKDRLPYEIEAPPLTPWIEPKHPGQTSPKFSGLN